MEYNLENCLKAKEELIKQGFSENSFYEADEYDVEIGYFIGEPIMTGEFNYDDDFTKSAFELYNEFLNSSQEDDDEMVDFFMNK